MIKLGQTNKDKVSNHCDIIIDLWNKVRLILTDHIKKH